MFFGSNGLRNLSTFTHNVIIISNARFLMTNVHTCQESVNITGKHIFISLRPQKCVMCIYGNRWAKFSRELWPGQKTAAQFGQIGWPILLEVKKASMKFQFLIFFAILASKGNTPTLWLKLLLVLGKIVLSKFVVDQILANQLTQQKFILVAKFLFLVHVKWVFPNLFLY